MTIVAVLAPSSWPGWVAPAPGLGRHSRRNRRCAQAAQHVAAASSVLDASGYVVARRQATVSSKVTGKVVEVFIEEGMRVEKDQVVAKLDDTTQQAQFVAGTRHRSDSARATLDEFSAQLRIARLERDRFQRPGRTQPDEHIECRYGGGHLRRAWLHGWKPAAKTSPLPSATCVPRRGRAVEHDDQARRSPAWSLPRTHSPAR